MLKRIKALKPRTKIILGCFLALAIYGAMQPQPTPLPRYIPNEDGRVVPGPRPDDQSSQLLAQFEAQRDELAPKVKACMDEQTRAQADMAIAAANGVMPTEPPCTQYMLQWAQQLNVAETEIHRLKTGDWHSSFNQLNGVSPSSGGGGAPSFYRPSTPNDDGTNAVDRWDRGAIRGTTMYKDENGEEKELPTANYYYHDLETGQYVPSESSTPPNDGHDYQPMTPEE
jgi:hypothetical protein